MGVYLYAICAGPVSPPAVPGVEDEPLQVVEAAGLGAVVSEAPRREEPLSEERLWAHERVVEQLMSERDVLPVRFGSVLADSDAVSEMLASRREELLAALARVAGARELAVRAAWEPPASASTLAPAPAHRAGQGGGAEYLMDRLAAQRRSRDLAARIDEALGAISREGRQRDPAGASASVRAAYLVDRERVDEFRARVERLGRELAGAEIVCTGPWPPYSFVGPQERHS